VFFSFFLNECFTDMSSLGRSGIRFLHKLNSPGLPTDLLEKGQNRVIDASLKLIRERAKLKVYVGFC
jgi:arginase